MSIQFSHTQKLEAWTQGKHAVIWLDGDLRISAKQMEEIKLELVNLLRDKGAFLTGADYKLPEPPRPLCNHCDERKTYKGQQYCPFCLDWAKTHNGDLPSDSVLDDRNASAKKYGPKDEQ